jgi:CheY-like chemotaxis protein
MKIAILEDNPAIYEYMAVALEMAGHHVQVYTLASTLLDTLLTAARDSSGLPYDLITVDVHLPGDFSGLDFIRRIRQALPSITVPMIIISGASPSFFGPLQDSYPPIPVLQKPFHMKTLLRILENMQGTAQKAEQLGQT